MSAAEVAPTLSAALTDRGLRLLNRWADDAERWWYDLPGHPGLGCYGTGYNWWGVQTNQKYLAAMAILAAHGGSVGADTGRALQRALAALRFSLASHVARSEATGVTCTDGKAWGQTWISALGIERMMHGLAAIHRHLTDDDRAALRQVITNEAEWLYSSHRRGDHHGVFADLWNASGENAPESNIWNGALLWRAAAMYPEHPQAHAWRERAHEFLINGVSVPDDAESELVLADKPVKERFRGANFFPNYALDHHGYLNVGYMAICASNAAILHFDLRRLKLAAPATLDHHQADLWRVLRRMVFSDGRLARIGGDSRVRYAYCQEYLLPALLYAGDHLDEPHALSLVERQLTLIEREAEHNGDGSFYGKRLAHLREANPYYYTRLESDRANVLGMLAAYLPLMKPATSPIDESFEESVRGPWVEPEHGAVMQRDPSRLASFAWRAYGLAQGMCQPPDDGHLAEWLGNLVGGVRFAGDGHASPEPPKRRLVRHHIAQFDGGFVTCGTIAEGAGVSMSEGWNGSDLLLHHILFAAMPDKHTVVVMQLIQAGDARVFTTEVKGLQLNLPNDLYNNFHRELVTDRGNVALAAPAERDEVLPLADRWAHLDGKLTAIGVYGADGLVVNRSARPRAGKLGSLHVDEICWGLHRGMRAWNPATTLLDTGCVVLSGVNLEQTRTFVSRPELGPIPFPDAPMVRGVSLVSMRNIRRAILANFGEEEARVRLPSGRRITLPAGEGIVI